MASPRDPCCTPRSAACHAAAVARKAGHAFWRSVAPWGRTQRSGEQCACRRVKFAAAAARLAAGRLAPQSPSAKAASGPVAAMQYLRRSIRGVRPLHLGRAASEIGHGGNGMATPRDWARTGRQRGACEFDRWRQQAWMTVMKAYRRCGCGVWSGVLLVLVVPDRAAGRLRSAQEMQYPVGAAVAEDGTCISRIRNSTAIWKFAGGKLEKFFEGSAKFRTPLYAVRCVAIDHQGKLLAGDSSTREVYRFDEAGKPIPLTQGKIGVPTLHRRAQEWRNPGGGSGTACASGRCRRKAVSQSSWPKWPASSDCVWTRTISCGSRRA